MAAISIPLAIKGQTIKTKGVLKFPEIKADGLAASVDYDDDKITKMVAETAKKEGNKLINKMVAERLKKIESGVQKTEAIYAKKNDTIKKVNATLLKKRGAIEAKQKKGGVKPSVVEAFNKEVKALKEQAEKLTKDLKEFKETCQTMLSEVVRSIQFKEIDAWLEKVVEDARKLTEKKAKKKINKKKWKKVGKIIAIGAVAVILTAAAITVSVLTMGVGAAALAAVIVPAVISGLAAIKSFADTGKKARLQPQKVYRKKLPRTSQPSRPSAKPSRTSGSA